MNLISRIFPRASISTYLVVMIMMITMPLVGFMGFLIFRLQVGEAEEDRRVLVESVSSVSRSMERRLQEMKTTLTLLSQFPELHTGDLQGFSRRIVPALRTEGLYIIAARSDGQQLLNTRAEQGQALPFVPEGADIASVLASGEVRVSNVFMGRTSGQWVFNVAMPYSQGDATNVLIMTQNAESLRPLIALDNGADGRNVSIVDAAGRVIVSSDPATFHTGDMFPDAARLPSYSGMSGSFMGEGAHKGTTFAYSRLAGWPWTAVIHGQAISDRTAFIDTWRQLILGSLFIVSIGLAGAFLVGGQLSASFRQIARMAERMGEGNIVPPVETRITEANLMSEALSNASFDRAQAEDRNHLILHELVHRSRNVLTLVQAMMRQLAREHDTIASFQKAVDHRLRGLGASVKALADVQWRGVSLEKLIVAHLETFGAGLDHVKMEGEDVILAPETAQNFGLVLHELATNSLKYGALSAPDGLLTISWQIIMVDGAEKIRISWRETGGPAAMAPTRKGFGTTIIKRHAEAAFGGVVEIDYAPTGLLWSMVASLQFFRLDKDSCPSVEKE